jgi:uncharacterized protein YndB with AHSA1/START domain
MTDMRSGGSTRNTKFIAASPQVIYHACTDSAALAIWRAPGDMTGEVHQFDLRVGGGYEMSLYYPSSEEVEHGKTSAGEDRFWARFVELVPPHRIVEAVRFDSADPAFAGELIMEVTLEPQGDGTLVTIRFEDLPAGIRPEDNEAGTQSALDKLAHYVE